MRVLEAARKLFVERGYTNTSLLDVARMVGTSQSGILRVCGSKAMLLQMVYGLCWSDTNAFIDATVEAATRVNPDPRFVTVAVIRGLLGRYETDKATRYFMLTYFQPYGAGEVTPDLEFMDEYAVSLLDGYQQFKNRLGRLSVAILEYDERLRKNGVTAIALREYLAGINYGIQISWFSAERSPDPNAYKMGMQEALAPLIAFLYGDLAEDVRTIISGS
jgi:AcrR family transcriptional regulator